MIHRKLVLARTVAGGEAKAWSDWSDLEIDVSGSSSSPLAVVAATLLLGVVESIESDRRLRH